MRDGGLTRDSMRRQSHGCTNNIHDDTTSNDNTYLHRCRGLDSPGLLTWGRLVQGVGALGQDPNGVTMRASSESGVSCFLCSCLRPPRWLAAWLPGYVAT